MPLIIGPTHHHVRSSVVIAPVATHCILKAKRPRKDVENDTCIWLVTVPEYRKIELKKLWLSDS